MCSEIHLSFIFFPPEDKTLRLTKGWLQKITSEQYSEQSSAYTLSGTNQWSLLDRNQCVTAALFALIKELALLAGRSSVCFTVLAPVYFAATSRYDSWVVLLFLHFDYFFLLVPGKPSKQKCKAKCKDVSPVSFIDLGAELSRAVITTRWMETQPGGGVVGLVGLVGLGSSARRQREQC